MQRRNPISSRIEAPAAGANFASSEISNLAQGWSILECM